jgi:guanylate kinase
MTGHLYVIAAPSGAGKTSLVQALLQREPQLALSISHTTRQPRATETDGREYHFISQAEFDRMAAAGDFLEHARVFDNGYGTGRAQVEKFLEAGRDAVLEIDWQGARQVRASSPGCRTVFVLPPSRESLRQRLQSRRTDSAEVIARRLADAVGDMSHYDEFDYVVVNDQFEHAVEQLREIVRGESPDLAERYGPRRPAIRALVASLLER